MKQSDFRVVFKSDFLPEGPYAVLASLPGDLKAKIRQAFLDVPTADKAASTSCPTARISASPR